MRNNWFVKSPLNYTGWKYKLLSEIFAFFPKEIITFIDLFCGWLNVWINITADNIVCIDKQEKLIRIFELLQKKTYNEVYKKIQVIIEEYNLSNSVLNWYNFYNSDSMQWLQDYNKQYYLNLRNDYNAIKENSEIKDYLLLVLIFFWFNNQIRFNSKGDYNIPVWKRDFNKSINKKLESFIDKLKKQNISFLNTRFQDYLVPDNAFVYCDPPYYLTTASYNENGAWTYSDEVDLLNYLLDLNNRKIKFALSNVLEHQGEKHTMLLDWGNKNNFKFHKINSNYNNSNYQKSINKGNSLEVLITNY